jgi:1-acyl-sn-glycerol-3-phosphate acyltransferase
MGARLEVMGQPMATGGMLVSNHISWSDILTLRSTRTINFVSKREVRDWPGVGLIAAVCDTVFIERKRSEAKRQEGELLARIERGELLCIFAEGTSTDGLRVLPFKSTLFSAIFDPAMKDEVWVQPVTVHYWPDPATGLPSNFYGWWGDMSFGGHIWDVVTRSRGGVATAMFHPPVRPADFPDRKALAQHCGETVEEGRRQIVALRQG